MKQKKETIDKRIILSIQKLREENELVYYSENKVTNETSYSNLFTDIFVNVCNEAIELLEKGIDVKIKFDSKEIETLFNKLVEINQNASQLLKLSEIEFVFTD